MSPSSCQILKYLFACNYVVCLCASPPKIETPLKTILEKTKQKNWKNNNRHCFCIKHFAKKKERWSVSPGMIVVEARTTFFLRETINNDCGQCRIRDNTLNIFTILPLLNKLFRYLLVYSYQTGSSKELWLQMDGIALKGLGLLLQDCLYLE